MATIVPTVESIGDEALTTSIIDRSITELQDNIITDLASYALYRCTALKKVVFGAVTIVPNYTFYGCTALEVADFHQTVTITSGAFGGCTALSALILRSDTKCTLDSSAGLNSTGISAGIGYIYVPAALVYSYKADTNWSTYADQIRAIEDYPEICDPYSWEAVAYYIEAGTYKDVYKIGDCVPVDLGSEGIINMQIAAFDADTLADGSGTAAISWVAATPLATKHRFNPALVTNEDGTYQDGTGAQGGWEQSELRDYLHNDIKVLIPNNVSTILKTVEKSHCLCEVGVYSTQTTHDELWVLSSGECGNDAQVLYTYEPGAQARYKEFRTSCGIYSRYIWLHSVLRENYGTTYNGSYNTEDVTKEHSIVLGFCTGATPT